MVGEKWFGNGSGNHILVLRFVKCEEFNRRHRREQKKCSKSRARAWFRVVGPGFLNLCSSESHLRI